MTITTNEELKKKIEEQEKMIREQGAVIAELFIFVMKHVQSGNMLHDVHNVKLCRKK